MARPDEERSGGRGTLILVVGPSGVGKDSLIAYCRTRVPSFAYPRRAITRRPDNNSEDHDSISEDDFGDRAAKGGFALRWRAHGLSYGIPASIAGDLRGGRSVVVNVSRAIIDEARKRFQPVLVVSVTAATEILADRLRRRGREAGETIDRRLARADEHDVSGPDVFPLDNSGPIEAAGDALVALLKARVGLV